VGDGRLTVEWLKESLFGLMHSIVKRTERKEARKEVGESYQKELCPQNSSSASWALKDLAEDLATIYPMLFEPHKGSKLENSPKITG
jgi:hypothetical protein